MMSYIVRCDAPDCTSTAEVFGKTREQTRDETAAAGWNHSDSGRTICPDCAQGFGPVAGEVTP